MFCTTHKCVVLVCGVLALSVGLSVSADDKSAPSGSWVRKEGELKVEFDGEGSMKICPHGDSGKVAIVCDCTVEKDGRIKVNVAGFEGSLEKEVEKMKEKIPVGLEFRFKWTVKEDTAKIGELQGEGDIVAHLKMHLEGDYEKT